MSDGTFQAKDLTFNVSKTSFEVDCGGTAQVADEVKCGQQTVKFLVLSLSDDQKKVLKEALRKALKDLEALDESAV